MADNIKYIRWAAGGLKVVMVINIILGAVVFVFALLGGRVDLIAPVNVVINAFITYTAARALELLADIAYHQLMAWHKQAGNNS